MAKLVVDVKSQDLSVLVDFLDRLKIKYFAVSDEAFNEMEEDVAMSLAVQEADINDLADKEEVLKSLRATD